MITPTSPEVGLGILQILAWIVVIYLFLHKLDNPYDED